MFGYLRFALAFLVLISHIGVKFYGLNPGVIAVVMFYILAGFVVSHIYTDILKDDKHKFLSFYKDRFLRIFPLYMYILSLTVVFLLLTSFSNPDFTFTNMIYNLSIIPLNFYMYLDLTILTKPSWWLIPPAWSLATELQAYILLPLALSLKKLNITLAFSSFVVYIIANFSLLNPDYFGYRFIVGVFFIFLVGSAIQKKEYKYPLYIWLSILLLVPIFYLTNSFSPTYTRETFIGLLVGIPTVYLLSKLKVKLPLNSLLGSLSYGLFLSHFLAIWMLKHFDFYSKNLYISIPLITFISIVISLFGIWVVEKQINKARFAKK